MSGGHRLVAHTADVIVEAWGPTRAECLAQAGMALTEIFASTAGLAPTAEVPVESASDDPGELLVGLLEELIYLAEARGVVAVRLDLEDREGGVAGTAEVVDADRVEQVGPVPKGVSREDLVCRAEPGGWRARAVVDV